MEEQNMSTDEQGALAAVHYAGIQKKLNEESWNDRAEDMMKAWGEKAAGLRWMHQKQGGIWKKFADKLTLWGIGITTFVSSASLVTAGIENAEYIMYGIGGIGMIASLIQALKKFYNAEDKVAEHSAIAKRFGSFYRAMTLELGMSRADRRPSNIVFEWASKEYDQLQNDAPSLGGGVVEEYKTLFGRQEHLPDIAEDVFIIEVFGRPETSEKHFFDSLDQKDVKIDDNLDKLNKLNNRNVEVNTTFNLEKPTNVPNAETTNKLLEKKLETVLESPKEVELTKSEGDNQV